MNGENITDFQKLESGNLAMPHLVLNSANSGDNWTSQGAYISIGESGALGSAAMHMTYRGDGYGYIGAGSVSNAVPGETYFRFDYNASDIFTPDDLGVGPSTENPVTALEVGATDGQSLMLTRSDGSISSGNQLGGIGFDGTDGNTPDDIREASASIIAFATESHGTGDKGGELTFWTSPNNQNDDTDGTERMSIGQDGHVRIGASSSAGNDLYINDRLIDWDNSSYYMDMSGTSYVNNLQVDGTVTFDYANADGNIDMDDYDIIDVDAIEVDKLYDADGGSRIEVYDDFDLNGNDIWGVNDMTVQTIYDNGGDIVHFDQGNSNTFKVRFDVGANRDIWMDKWDGNHPMIRPGTNARGFNGKFNAYWYETYTLRIWRNQEYGFSDRRLKENIRQLTGGNSLDKIMSLSGKIYDLNRDLHPQLGPDQDIEEHVWKDNLGFIAQELKEVIPEMVILDENTGYYAIKNYEQLLPVIIEAMKEQQSQIEALKSGNSNSANDDGLKTENAELRSLIEQMQKRLEALESKK
jgi:hypothetical protein